MNIRDYKIGDRVVVINPLSKYYLYRATVTNVYFYKKQVRIVPDNAKHILRLMESSIAKLDKEEKGDNKMKEALTGFTRVAVIKQDNKDYKYALYNEDIKVGDAVLVSGKAKNSIWIMGNIEDIVENENISITEEVICKVDYSAYKKRCENRKKIVELRNELNKKKVEIDKRKNDEYYASLDDEYADILNQLKELER